MTTFCAPPTVWRMLVQQDLARWQLSLRELVGAGEPLNPEVIEQVQRAWGITIRDGFGQTETTARSATRRRAGQAGLDGPAAAGLHVVLGRSGDRGASQPNRPPGDARARSASTSPTGRWR